MKTCVQFIWCDWFVCVIFTRQKFQKFWFFFKMVQLNEKIGILYLLILSKSYHIWKFCIILNDLILLLKPRFLHIFYKSSPLLISFSRHSCFYGNSSKFYICPWCSKFNLLFNAFFHFNLIDMKSHKKGSRPTITHKIFETNSSFHVN